MKKTDPRVDNESWVRATDPARLERISRCAGHEQFLRSQLNLQRIIVTFFCKRKTCHIFNLSAQEVQSCLTRRIAADTKSGLYPVLNGVAEELEKLQLKDRRPLLSYNQVNELLFRHVDTLCTIS